VRVFLGGIVTETNTLSPIPTGVDDWVVVRDLADAEAGGALEAFAQEATARGDELAFGLYAFAMPAGVTTRAAWTGLRDELLGMLQAAMPVDAVLLPLHGAMVAAAEDGGWVDDAEGELIARVREIVGPDVKIGVHIDLHCHLTQAMLDGSDALVIYKEYPHTDMADRARDLYALIADTVAGKIRPTMAMFDCRMMGIYPTNPQPMRGFVDAMMAAERGPLSGGGDGVLSLSLGHGFPWGDVPDSGARFLAVTDGDPGLAASTAEAWGRRFHDLRREVAVKPLPLDAALDRALAVLEAGRGPVVIADQADNAGGGAPSDATFALRRLLERRVEGAAVAMMWDPIARHLAKSAGVGARLTLRLGGKMGPASGDPLDLDVTVMGLVDGLVQRWPQTEGAVDSPGGDVAHLRVHGLVGDTGGPEVDVIVTTRRGQVLGLEPFTAFGITADTHRILVVKSIQHFYAAFAPIAAEVVYMAAPGAVAPIMEQIPLVRADLHKYPWVEAPFGEG
jgi:microcystin degradation protein MlrC